MMQKFYLLSLLTLLSACGYSARGINQEPPQRYVHKYGVDVTQEDWERRGKDGDVITTTTAGVTIRKRFSHGIQDGETTYSFPHRQEVAKSEMWKEGQLQSEFMLYLTGEKEREILYFPGGRKETQWFESGSLYAEEEYHDKFLVEGRYFTPQKEEEAHVVNKEGTRVNRDHYGQLISVEMISSGEVTKRTLFFPNGIPKEETPFVSGIVEGVRRTFFPDGSPESIEEWKNGTQSGLTTLFQNGERMAEVSYKRGLKNGIEHLYDDRQNLLEEIHWLNNKKHGAHIHYGPERTTTEWYIRGRSVSPKEWEQFQK